MVDSTAVYGRYGTYMQVCIRYVRARTCRCVHITCVYGTVRPVAVVVGAVAGAILVAGRGTVSHGHGGASGVSMVLHKSVTDIAIHFGCGFMNTWYIS